jgi:hypothetical protein
LSRLVDVDCDYQAVGELIMIGYWYNDQHPEWPNPAELVDLAWDKWERHQTVRYPEKGALAVQWRGYSWCRMCELTTNGTSDLTDGVYLCPAGLAHYIDEHGVRLPGPIVTHFLAQAEAREAAV